MAGGAGLGAGAVTGSTMQPVNRNPSDRELRNFGLAMLAGFAVIGGLLWAAGRARGAGWAWAGSSHQIGSIVAWSLGVLFAGAGVAWRAAGRPLYVVWMTGARALGILMTSVLLTALFVAVLPIFALIRFKDPLRTRLVARDSYWEPPTPHEPTLDRTRRPF